MGKKYCEEKCNPCYHVHPYILYTRVDECHRPIMRGITSPAQDTPGHKHEYEGVTSCNDGHTHRYRGCTDRPEYMCNGHVHNFCGKTSCEEEHRHRYEGTTEKDRRSFRG
jgi:YmaF family